MRPYCFSHWWCVAEKFIFGTGSSPIALSLFTSARILSALQLPFTASSGWLGYSRNSPRSITTMLNFRLFAWSMVRFQTSSEK